MRPKVVVFDLGKVLLDFDYSIAAHRIVQKARTTIDEARLFLDQSPLLHRYETGHLTTGQFYEEICTLCGFTGTADEFAEFFGDIFTPIPEMIQLHARLRESGVPTYIFSNTNDLAIGHIRRRFPFFQHFDGYVLSYEHGSMKPDPKLYAVVERITACRGSDIAYLDDRSENIDAALKLGWNAVVHQTPEQSRAALKMLGLPV
jgi:glucose-1-phosphatase